MQTTAISPFSEPSITPFEPTPSHFPTHFSPFKEQPSLAGLAFTADVKDFTPGLNSASKASNSASDANPFADCSSTAAFIPTAMSFAPAAEFNPTLLSMEQKNALLGAKTFVQRSMYKRELCKNWESTGLCRFNDLCQYAHGYEELSDEHHLYLQEQMCSPNDKYKSQNCRTFYKDKVCQYGRRCHFRHEFRTFKKIHRHFYMCHLAAATYTHVDMIAESHNTVDEEPSSPLLASRNKSASFHDSDCDIFSDLDLKETQSLMTGTGSDSAQPEKSTQQIFNWRPRLHVFAEATGDASPD